MYSIDIHGIALILGLMTLRLGVPVLIMILLGEGMKRLAPRTL